MSIPPNTPAPTEPHPKNATRCTTTPPHPCLSDLPFSPAAERNTAPILALLWAWLPLRDLRWGLRSLQQVQGAALDAGLVLAERRAMPANNLMLRLAAAS
jgi:hypothetical protein